MAATYVTAEIPGTAGRLRHEPADFAVEEIPLYEPSGEGDHLYLRIEKRGITTHEAVHRIARLLGVKPRSVGVAGLKDARAVTVQTISIEHVQESAVRKALRSVESVELVGLSRHRNKLKLGHLRGNRFTIRVRGVVPDGRARAAATLDRLAAAGCANWFGAQRFGMRRDNDVVGRALVLGDADAAVRAVLALDASSDIDAAAESRALASEGRHADALAALPRGFRTEAAVLRELARERPPERALSAIPRNLLRLYVSAYQSRLFNRLLADRLRTLDRLEDGDLAYLHDRGAVFSVEDAAATQPRADTLEVSPSGPLFGTRLLFASGAPGDRERALFEAEGLRPELFRVRTAGEMQGERRPLRIPISDHDAREVTPETDDAEHTVVLRFTLPRGCFATTVLGEVLKTAATAPPGEAPGSGLQVGGGDSVDASSDPEPRA